MTLPALPPKKNKREANWTTTFLKKWVLEESTLPSGPIEVKVTTTNSIPFSAVTQLNDLLQCTTKKGFWYKHPDSGMANRFDVTFYRDSPAFIIIKFPKGSCVITAQTFALEKEKSKRKSLTHERARDISIIDF